MPTVPGVSWPWEGAQLTISTPTGGNADVEDHETGADVQNLEQYAAAFRELGYTCEAFIGYGSAKKAIPMLVKEVKADLLVMGSHGHKVTKDLIFGTTVGAVRHAVDIPVLIVR